VTEFTDARPASRNVTRFEALLDPGSEKLIESRGALTVVEGHCKGRLLRLALTDRSVAGGSLGVDESDLLRSCFERCRTEKTPILLALDSGGARLTSGLAGLAAFRRMYRSALDLRLAGMPMVALIERDCFGGASMLAMLCVVRGALPSARIGMSGPAIIETLAGKQDLDASDREAVRALFGALTRARAGAIDIVFDEQVSRADTLAQLLGLAADKQGDVFEQHQRLKQRLSDTGVGIPVPTLESATRLFRRGVAVGAAEIWQLADAVLGARTGEAVLLRVNCPGQAATRRDELLVLSEYVAHLALCLRVASSRGVELITRIEGESAGGIYVALASGAASVEANPEAMVRVLPGKAIQVVVRETPPTETLADALRTGVVDRVVEGAESCVAERAASTVAGQVKQY
jgi:acetyl-CoA carboxylase beta subunit